MSVNYVSSFSSMKALIALTMILSVSTVRAAEPFVPAPAPAIPEPVLLVMSTNLGDMTLELWPEFAPVTVENFLTYVDAGFFNGLIFHRVIPGFMIQGGGFEPALNKRKPRAPIPNEANNGLLNGRGTLAMARTSDINSATAQFFINLKNNTFLNHGARDYGYAVFGRVLEGMDVVDNISRQPTRRVGGHANLPTKPIVIQSIKRKSLAVSEAAEPAN